MKRWTRSDQKEVSVKNCKTDVGLTSLARTEAVKSQVGLHGDVLETARIPEDDLTFPQATQATQKGLDDDDDGKAAVLVVRELARNPLAQDVVSGVAANKLGGHVGGRHAACREDFRDVGCDFLVH